MCSSSGPQVLRFVGEEEGKWKRRQDFATLAVEEAELGG